MNAKSIFFFLLCAAAAGARAQVPSAGSAADSALIEWEPSSSWRASAGYTHRLRPVEPVRGGAEWTIAGESYDACVEWTCGWFDVRAFAGATRARLKEFASDDLDMEAGGGAGLGLNLWQISPDDVHCAWRVILRVEGRAEWRSTSDDRDSLEWFEGFGAAPVSYVLTTSRSRVNSDIRDFHAIGAYAGPAVSMIDGRREFAGTKTDFEQSDLAGAVAGVDLWLLSNLRFGGRLEYFGDCTWSLSCEYSF